MEKIDIRIKRINDKALLPVYATEFSAGADLYACLDNEIVIEPGKSYMIPTGIIVELPENTVGLIYARSGLAVKKGLAPSNKVGVIDSDYRGEIKVSLYNHGEVAQSVLPGERVAQMVITPYLTANYIECTELAATASGSGGFGSTGNK